MAPRVSSPGFVGRGDELGALVAALGPAAAEGLPAAFFIGGEAGVGKTRLVREFAARAGSAGFRVLVGGCIELAQGGLPFAPVVEALRPLADELAPDALASLAGPGRTELVRLVPALGEAEDRFGGREANGEQAGGAQGRLFELLLLFLHRLAVDHPLVLVLEDLHWADRSTLDLLRFLVRNLRDLRLVLIATYRSDELHRRHPLTPVLAELTRTGAIDRFELPRFGRDEVAAQLAGIIGDAPPRELVERIFARSEGNAFYTEELLAADVTGERLPPTLREVLLTRVAGLGEPTQELLRVAAVAGGPVTGGLLAAVAGSDEAALFPALREAVAAGLLVVDPGADAYGFRHALTGEAVADELLPGERTALHAAYARELSEDAGWVADPARAAAVAAHWTDAHDLPRALEASIAAGLAAERAYAYPEAQAQYERAFELWAKVPDAADVASLDRVGLLERAATVADLAGSLPRAIALLEAALAALDPIADPVRAGLLYSRLAMIHMERHDSPAAFAAQTTAVRLVPASPASVARARVLTGLGRQLAYHARDDEAIPLLDEAIEIAGVLGATDVQVNATATRATLKIATTRESDVQLAALKRAAAIAREAGDAWGVVRVAHNVAWLVWTYLADLETSRAVSLEGLAEARRNGLGLSSQGLNLVFLAASALHDLGRWDEAEAVLAEVDIRNDDAALDSIYLVRGQIDIGRGRFERARHALGIATRLLERSDEPSDRLYGGIVPVELDLWEGRPRDARAGLADAAARVARMQDLNVVDVIGQFHTFALRAEADLATLARSRRDARDLEEARARGTAHLAGMRDLHDEVGRDRPVYVRWTTPYLALAEAEASRLEGASDPGHWAAAAAAFDVLGMQYVRAYALYREAEAHLVTGVSRVAATDPLRNAHRIALRIRATPLQGELEALARRGRIELVAAPAPSPVPVSPLGSFGLTSREREVLGLLAAGRTNREIATELFITEKTASVHVSNILGKLGVAHRIEAAAIAHRAGLATTWRRSGDRPPTASSRGCSPTSRRGSSAWSVSRPPESGSGSPGHRPAATKATSSPAWSCPTRLTSSGSGRRSGRSTPSIGLPPSPAPLPGLPRRPPGSARCWSGVGPAHGAPRRGRRGPHPLLSRGVRGVESGVLRPARLRGRRDLTRPVLGRTGDLDEPARSSRTGPPRCRR